MPPPLGHAPPARAPLVVVLLILTLLLAAVATTVRAASPAAGPATMADMDADLDIAEVDIAEVDIAELVASLTDAELVGQVLMPYAFGEHATEVAPAAAQANREYAGVATPAELVARYQVGGVILLRRTDPAGAAAPESNIVSPAQARALADGLQAASAGPLLIGIDQEYGVVTRLTEGVTGLPSAMAFGAAGEPALTEAAWRVAGTELAAAGVNLNFAPVADVLDGASAGGGIIGSRSYGSDPDLVSQQVAATVRGLQGAGVAATLKHFPGHGNTVVDSHEELPVVAASHPLARADLPPFAAGIDAGAWLVMSGHLDVRPVEPGIPATFSRAAVTDLLRGELGFEGVAVTDALNMAPAQRWPAGEAAVRALLAGNDLLLMPPDLPAAYDGLLAAVDDGTLPRQRLREAVTRVLTLKQRLAGSAPPAPPELAVLDSPAHHAAVGPAAAAAVTMLRGGCDPAPVAGRVTVTASGGRDQARAWLTEALTGAGVTVVADGDQVVHLVGYGDGAADLAEDATVTVAMDTPYLLARAGSPVLLATYSSSQASMRALAAVLAGQAPAPGRSPVAVPGLPRSACEVTS